ncbi:MAG: cysteine desulfurase-like protein [Alphaproteobacteria bacterium]|nr:MAG: cysteine desulfurase-like protein [Alphaproteobacteria bacterium]
MTGRGPSHDVEAVRALFPALGRRLGARPAIYLDNPAGTQVPAGVAEAVGDAILNRNANLGGDFATSREAGEIVTAAHAAMADFLGAGSAEEIVIGPNMTTLTYQLSRTLARAWHHGDEIVVTQMDHEGNVGPWLQAAQERGVTVRWVPFSEESWQVEPDHLRPELSDRTRLVALGYASNLTGSINRVRELARLAREAGALVYVDAVQFAPHGLVDVAELGCDFLACSAYKFFGPHLGIVWVRRAVLEEMEPYKLVCSSNALPGRFETGTPQIELQAGLVAAVEHFARLGEMAGATGSRRDRIAAAYGAAIAHENPLAARLIDGIAGIDGLRILGITDDRRLAERVPTVSFLIDGVAPRSLVELMNAEGIFCWASHNYAWRIFQQLGLDPNEGVIRIGIANYNTTGEIDATIDSIRRNLAVLRQQR